MDKNEKMSHGEMEKCMWCGGHGWHGWHGGRFWVLRWILLVLILLAVFSLGVKVGQFKAFFGYGGYGYGMHGGYYGYPMMGGYYGGYGPMMNGGWYAPQQAPLPTR